MVEAKQSCGERQRAARAQARAERLAREQAWHRQLELHVEVRRLALDAVKASIRARGDKVQLYKLCPASGSGQCDDRAVADHATSKGPVDEVVERLLRPFRFWEGIRVAGPVDFVPIDSLPRLVA